MNDQPRVLLAKCLLPQHECQRVLRRAIHHAAPSLVIHLKPDWVDIRLVVHRPWELTGECRHMLVNVFEPWGAVEPLPSARVSIERTVAQWHHLPRRFLTEFVVDIEVYLRFQRIEV